MKKIYIIEPSFIDYGIDVAKEIISRNDDLSICYTTSSKEEYKNNSSENYINYLHAGDINLAFQNNMTLFVHFVKDGEMSCITLDNFYNSDIIVVKNYNFNNISELYTEDCLIIWLDEKCKRSEMKSVNRDINETKYILERIESQNLKYLYFLGETVEEIADIVYVYLNADDDKKIEIEENYN